MEGNVRGMFQHLVELIMKNKGSSKSKTKANPIKGPVKVPYQPGPSYLRLSVRKPPPLEEGFNSPCTSFSSDSFNSRGTPGGPVCSKRFVESSNSSPAYTAKLTFSGFCRQNQQCRGRGGL